MSVGRILFWFNFSAMLLNIIVFVANGSPVNAVCAVVSAAITGYCRWDNGRSIEEDK